MTDIYVPIDYSNLKSVIPPGEDIIYSTLCKAKKGSAGLAGYTTTKWLSHVLMTTKGIAFTVPHRKKPTKAFYTDWYSMKKFGKKGFVYKLKTYYRIVREPNFESNNEFRERSKNFLATINPIIQSRRKEWESKIPDKRERNIVAKDRKFEMEI